MSDLAGWLIRVFIALVERIMIVTFDVYTWYVSLAPGWFILVTALVLAATFFSIRFYNKRFR